MTEIQLKKIRIGELERKKLESLYIEVDALGEFQVHPETIVEPPVRFFASLSHNKPLRMGAFSYASCSFGTRPISVGRYCSIAWALSIGDTEHPTDRLTTSPVTYWPYNFTQFAQDRGLKSWERRITPPSTAALTVTIGNDVWIGQNAYIKAGITVGDGAVIGAFAVVTKNVPPYAIVAGNPARIIRLRFPENLIEEIVSSAWWQYSFTDLQDFDLTQPGDAVRRIQDAAVAGKIKPYEPAWINLANLFPMSP